jgi:hypothetical protein
MGGAIEPIEPKTHAISPGGPQCVGTASTILDPKFGCAIVKRRDDPQSTGTRAGTLQPPTLARAAILLTSLLVQINGASIARSDDATATILLVRHGEKPDLEYGQLKCQGLNRALALGGVIANRFGTPNVIFAPNPSHSEKPGEPFGYLRAFATVEPSAILFGLPVDVSVDVSDVPGLTGAIEKALSARSNALILVAWEHKRIEEIAQKLLSAHGGDPSVVPKWKGDDFDSIYVITVTNAKASFAVKQEGLNGLSDSCPH